VTEAEYLALEAISDVRHEWVGGEIVAMAGGSDRHNVIAVNLVGELRDRLRGGPCQPFASDQRLHVEATGLYTAVGIPRNMYVFDVPGRVAIYLGPLEAGDATEADADLTVSGSEAPDAFGYELIAADTDGDGDHELVVGAPYDGSLWDGAGAVYLFDP
jgi:hypothetical protein